MYQEFWVSIFPTCTPRKILRGGWTHDIGDFWELGSQYCSAVSTVCQENTAYPTSQVTTNIQVYVPQPQQVEALQRLGFHSAEEWPASAQSQGPLVLRNHRTPVRSCQYQDGRELYHWAATLCYWQCGVSNTWDTSLLLYTPRSWQMGWHSRYWTHWVNEQAVLDC